MNKQTVVSFIKLIRETKPSVARMLIAVTLSVVATIVGLLIPMLTKSFVDGFDIQNIKTWMIVGLVIVFVLQSIANGVSIYLLNYIGQQLVARLRERLWKKHLSLRVPFYDDNKSGELISRITNDTSIVKNLITDHLVDFFTGIISIIGAVAILIYLDWQMTLVMLVTVPLAIGVIVPLARKMYKISKSLQDETASFTSLVSQVLSEIRLVKASNAESREQENGFGAIRTLFQYGLKEARIQAIVIPLMSFIMMGMLVIVLGYGGYRVSNGTLTAGDLVAFILYLFQIVVPLSRFTNFFTQLQKAVGAMERVQFILDEEEEEYDGGVSFEGFNQPIVIDDVSFGYGNESDVLRDLSFTIPNQSTTALVGPSGSGKTTFFALMEQFYSPTSGGIRHGEQAIQEYDLAEWRKRIGYVSQESPILSGTIRENIVYGVERDVTEEELRQVAVMSYADQFIEQLPNGYDTEVGERGMKLSGGQRQRIGIARALIRDPELLLLDEATSSLDSKAEQVVQQALNNLMKGRTTIVIAHRLSTVVNADQLIFLDQGAITGKGTHEELYRTHATYRQFADQQLHVKELENRALFD
ncbi:multidrug ABC transporter permease [Pontibacillus halophilus JSM 076056 = DSM 19796]|uniref:Multidrug ABC transporter permease n=1 Tax=Pontibacillus halophilus JSM 076056 = DSM 19796 TaxID=1385510 RepID=A0A0A5GGY2_9BACI|nr:ABC transporter ATP-binding protein [Pontibacillus halophilus]KGX91284.1 multidrug ABC transporter permease [Pontibacillus halophilus JSM 076056 = DSM 19796]